MTISNWKQPETMTTIFQIEIPDFDFVLLALNQVDRDLLDLYMASTSVADKIQGLELIARRLEEGDQPLP